MHWTWCRTLLCDGVRPLRRLRALALDVSCNPEITQAGLADGLSDLPPTLTVLHLSIDGLPHVHAVDLGAAMGCRTLRLSAGFSWRIGIILPPTVERIELYLAGSMLHGPIAFPSSVRSVLLDMDGADVVGGGSFVARPPGLERLEVSLRGAADSAVKWLTGLASPSVAAVVWSGDGIDVDFLASVAPRDELSLEFGTCRPGSDARETGALRRLLATGVARHRCTLRIVGPYSTTDQIDVIHAAAAACSVHLTLHLASPTPAAVAMALRGLLCTRSAASGLFTTVYCDSTLSHGLGGPRVLRHLSALRGVAVYPMICDLTVPDLFAALSGNHLFIQ